MNLLSLIIIFLALVICGAVGYIAWELTADDPAEKPESPADSVGTHLRADPNSEATPPRDPADTP